MSKPDYSVIDKLIVETIRLGNNTFYLINTEKVAAEASRLSKEVGEDAYRVVDRRLQALRKKSAIQFGTKSKWKANETAA